MNPRVFLPIHADLEVATAALLARDPMFAITSVPSGVVRGILELTGIGQRQPTAFWPETDPDHRHPAGDEAVAADWAGLAASAPRGTMIEIAIGRLGHHELHWRMIDVTHFAGTDVRAQPTDTRHALMLELYQARRRDGAHVRLMRQEIANLITPDRGKAAYLAEGPGRTGDQMAFRRLAAAYEEPWLLAPTGWRVA